MVSMPTVSFPVAGTLMIEPTESENLEELIVL
jgi:glycine cleavage system protein P-like pyridoxal-binding family